LEAVNRYGSLAGRILISIIFLKSGFGKIVDFGLIQQYMVDVGIPATAFILIIAILVEISGGLLVLFGLKARTGAMLLILFLVPTTLIFHPYMTDQLQFMKNLAIIGGLVGITVHGSGPISIKE
jgi:putative oxidoreductase